MNISVFSCWVCLLFYHPAVHLYQRLVGDDNIFSIYPTLAAGWTVSRNYDGAFRSAGLQSSESHRRLVGNIQVGPGPEAEKRGGVCDLLH